MLPSVASLARTVPAIGLVGAMSFARPAIGQQRDNIVLSLRSGGVVLSPASSHAFWSGLMSTSAQRLHALVYLARDPSPFERDSLRRLGLTILSPLGDGVFWAAIERNADTVGAPLRPVYYLAVQPRDRVAPELLNADHTRFVTRGRNGSARNYVVNGDSSLNLVAVFHTGTPVAEATRLIASVTAKARRLSDTRWKLTTNQAGIRRLAAADIIRWIDAAYLPVVSDNDKTRAAINVDAVQSFNTTTGHADGLGGAGITVGLFDYGIDEGHADFGTRVVVNDGGLDAHATHIAGVIGGSGAASAGFDSWNPSTASPTHANGGSVFQWRGMAPDVKLIDADAESYAFDATKIRTYIASGMAISNHSYGLSVNGLYSEGDATDDELIRGDATDAGTPIPARERVYSAGNDGDTNNTASTQQEVGYFALNKQLKNGIVVGSFDAQSHHIDSQSSLGPTQDGRIKPDVVAPGVNVTSTGYCRVASSDPYADPWAQCSGAPLGSSRHSFYHSISGTSVSAAAVTGMLALVLQQFNATYGTASPGWFLLPSSLRAITVHSAQDISGPVWFTNADGPVQAFAGPDFVTGYGLVDAKAAVELVADRKFVEDAVTEVCQERTWWVLVTQPELKVTLAWDDVASPIETTASTDPRLINDLDLEVVAPDGTTHYPWLLDQQITKDGVAVAPAAQVCGSNVKVARKVTPTLTPKFISVGNPGNVNDPLSGGVLEAAQTGKDHLNNLEQVVVSAPAQGWWKIRVIGFKVPSDQPFSLVASEPLRLRIPFLVPSFFCWIKALCHPVSYEVHICETVPDLCHPIEVKPGHLILTFSKPAQAMVIPLDRVCVFVIKCPVCIRDSLCRQVEIHLANMPKDFAVAVYDTAGHRVASNNSERRVKSITAPTKAGNTYILVVGSGTNTRLNQTYDLRIDVIGRQ